MRKSLVALQLLVSLVAMPLGAQQLDSAQKVWEAGWQALQSGEADRAALIFRQALERTPSDGVLHFGAGIAAHMLGRDRDARQSLKRALELEPRLKDAARLLGEIEY